MRNSTLIEASKLDYYEVVKLCNQFPQNNERILSSAYFAIGKIHLDQNERPEALEMFM